MPLVTIAWAVFFMGYTSASHGEPGARLDLFWASPSGSWRIPIRIAQNEVERAFEALGVEVTWRRSSSGGELRPTELAVVLLTHPSPNQAVPTRVMGAAPTNARTPVVVVLGPGLLRTLGWDERRPASLQGEEKLALGRSLGRVILHELLHVLVPGREHTEAGLMQSRLTRARLLDPELGLTQDWIGDVSRAVRLPWRHSAAAQVPGEMRPEGDEAGADLEYRCAYSSSSLPRE